MLFLSMTLCYNKKERLGRRLPFWEILKITYALGCRP